MREECGVFAVSGDDAAAELAFLGLYALQHRGQESAGIVSVDDRGNARIHK
ncbi:MAG: amidophosphoribosyltransferase, partial [Gemmatimonadetes bacterium]|nr:amidophosphoribosyltransferase [Gemmatimonadota bacterium]NIV24240.1 amidophosphoribosyltransferase [Gemmatimonadota bacterium]NIW76058.1 amidophosphoribosyltransferase [Gemmatimonadota bacterium]NIY42046.1 amidophosphoribosyltransferase [Gemmatimonadota bacterium]